MQDLEVMNVEELMEVKGGANIDHGVEITCTTGAVTCTSGAISK